MFISVLSLDISGELENGHTEQNEDGQSVLSHKVCLSNSNNSQVRYYDLSIVLYLARCYSEAFTQLNFILCKQCLHIQAISIFQNQVKTPLAISDLHVKNATKPHSTIEIGKIRVNICKLYRQQSYLNTSCNTPV